MQAAPMAAAMLLLEVAWADQNITDAELASTREAVQAMFKLTDEQVQGLIDRAKSEHDTAISMYPFTRAVRRWRYRWPLKDHVIHDAHRSVRAVGPRGLPTSSIDVPT